MTIMVNFADLPKEIRALIWEEVATQPRDVFISVKSRKPFPDLDETPLTPDSASHLSAAGEPFAISFEAQDLSPTVNETANSPDSEGQSSDTEDILAPDSERQFSATDGLLTSSSESQFSLTDGPTPANLYLVSMTPVPPLLHVCSEARKIGLKHYQAKFSLGLRPKTRIQPDKTGGRYIYVNPKVDTLFLQIGKLAGYDENVDDRFWLLFMKKEKLDAIPLGSMEWCFLLFWGPKRQMCDRGEIVVVERRLETHIDSEEGVGASELTLVVLPNAQSDGADDDGAEDDGDEGCHNGKYNYLLDKIRSCSSHPMEESGRKEWSLGRNMIRFSQDLFFDCLLESLLREEEEGLLMIPEFPDPYTCDPEKVLVGSPKRYEKST
jgi:hypothetical protein